MINFLASPWIPVLVLIVLAGLARFSQGSWLAPSAFAPLLWSVYAGAPLLILKDTIESSTVWVIVLLILSAQVGAFLTEDASVRQLSRRRTNVSVYSNLVWRRAQRIGTACSIVALLGAGAFVVVALKQTGLPFSWDGVSHLGAVMYGLMVAGDAQPWWFRLTRMWVFPAVILGGMVFPTASSPGKKALTLLGFAPALLMGTTLASRFGTAMAIACWIGAYLAARASMSRGRFRIRRLLLMTGLSVFAAATLMYVALGAVRGQKYEDWESDYVYVGSNLFGYLAVFDNFVRNQSQPDHTFGIYSFGGPFELLGLKKRETALGYVPVVLENGVDSNLYTAFRGLIQDFSLPGAIVLLFGFGFLAGRAYTSSCLGRIGQVPILAAYYSFVFWSPIVSVFYYNSVLLALLVAWICIRKRATPVEAPETV